MATKYYIKGEEVTKEEYIKYKNERKLSKKALLQKELKAAKAELASTDYKAIKYAEGLYTDEEYANTRYDRQKLRSKIKELEAQIKKLDK